MTDLRIRVYKLGKDEPSTSVRIPGEVLKFAARLIPNKALEAMREKGVDLDEVIRLADTPGWSGTLAEVEDHEKGERVVIALE